MKLKLYSILLIGIVSLVLSCRTAKKMYEKGNYDEAVQLAAKKLQKDPHDSKTINIIQNAYRFAVEDHLSRIRQNDASTNELKWEWNYNQYLAMQRLYEAIHRSPSVFDIVKPVDYSSQMGVLAEKAGEIRYARGMSYMNSYNKRDFQQAYREFAAALAFIPGDINIRQKMDEAYENAVVNVVVEPIQERGSYQYVSFTNRYRNFDDNILRYLQANNSNIFIRYYTEYEARSRNIRPDQVVDIHFSSINIGRNHDDLDTRTVSRDVVVKETVYRPDSIVKEYAKVYAKITTTKRTMRSEGIMQISIRDENNNRAWTENYTGQHFWSTEFASYTGDARALSDSDKELINRNREYPPREDDILRCIMDEIQSKVQCGVKDYYNRY